MRIRKATIEDLEPLSRLFDLYRIFYHQLSDQDAARDFLKERISKNESVIFVAEEQEELIGFTQLYPIFSSVGLRRAWLLNDLYVDKKARKRGAAAALLKAAREHGASTSARWLLLQTGCDNRPAQGLYEKEGWIRENDFFYRLDI